jgi:shikimate 5-dehydrogenase
VNWINKDTELYCSFAKEAGNTGCQFMNSAFFYYGLNKIYKSFSVDNIKDAVDAVKTLNIKGFAVTMPYKVQILDYIDNFDVTVDKVGAANTIINNNGKLKAYNTDYLAAHEFLSSCCGTNICILGNGGYAKAVTVAAKELELNINIITRKSWDDIKKIDNSIIYNCTPVTNIEYNKYTNQFIDSKVITKTGKKLANKQAAHQFKLYTGLEFPYEV